ncbi:phage tail assembly protein [Salmonella enterica]|nr:phage tail assembly protein [Salmonella enterica subsp. enterica]ELT5843938.1 phage tail assembly protein [Salmonella enterica]
MESLLDSMTIPLSRPYIIDGTEHKELVMCEPKLRDRIMFSKDKGDEEERSARMISRLINVDVKALYDLPDCDYSKLEAAFNEMVKPPEKRKEIS